MKHPGFTAEASLYKSEGLYAMAWTRTISTAQVAPQRMIDPSTCYTACWNCVYGYGYTFGLWCLICDWCLPKIQRSGSVARIS